MNCLDDYFEWLIDEKYNFRKLSFKFQTIFTKEMDKFNGWDGNYRICSECKETLPLNSYFYASGGKDKFHRYCKKCEGSPYYGWGRVYNNELNKTNLHYCNKCDRILPLNIMYFSKSRGRCNKTGFASNCKECTNESFGIKSINTNKDILGIKIDYKVCSSCLLELPNDDNYFLKKNDRENGMCICKKCNGYEYKIYRLNIVLKDMIPVGFKYCNKCRMLIADNEYDKNTKRCNECSRKSRKLYNQKPQTKRRIRNSIEKRRSAKLNLKNDLTNKEWIETLKYFNDTCAYCGMTEEDHQNKFNQCLHQEHIIPLSKNGEYTKYNIIPSCKTCNTSKGNRDLDVFYLSNDNFSIDKYEKVLEFTNLYRYKI